MRPVYRCLGIRYWLDAALAQSGVVVEYFDR